MLPANLGCAELLGDSSASYLTYGTLTKLSLARTEPPTAITVGSRLILDNERPRHVCPVVAPMHLLS